jgi:hypothetical protein
MSTKFFYAFAKTTLVSLDTTNYLLGLPCTSMSMAPVDSLHNISYVKTKYNRIIKM